MNKNIFFYEFDMNFLLEIFLKIESIERRVEIPYDVIMSDMMLTDPDGN